MKANLELVGSSVKRETEKAIYVSVECDGACGQFSKDVWFPKSQTEVIDGVVFASEWIVGAKEKDLSAGGNWVGFQTARVELVEA